MAGSKTITNPGGAFGYSTLEQQGWSESGAFMVSTAAVAAKQVVQIDPAGNTCRVATTTPSPLQVGITLGPGGIGQVVNVAVQGSVAAVPYTGTAPVAGDILIQSATTAGRVAVSNTPGIGQSIGRAIGAGVGGLVDVWVGPAYLS
jgi:hypothetical protein